MACLADSNTPSAYKYSACYYSAMARLALDEIDYRLASAIDYIDTTGH